MGLEPFKNMEVCNLSKSEQRKLSISIALIGNPEIILLDEPS